MYLLTTEQTFDAAHFLKGHLGACSNIHGHRWRVIARISAPELEDAGSSRAMIMDFGDFKSILKDLVDRYDHTLIYEQGSLRESTLNALREEGFSLTELPVRPTAENFAKLFYEALSRELPVCRVTVYETPQNCASYEEES